MAPKFLNSKLNVNQIFKFDFIITTASSNYYCKMTMRFQAVW